MNAEILVQAGVINDHVHNFFASEHEDWWSFTLVVDGTPIVTTTDLGDKVFNEIFEITSDTEIVDINIDRLNRILAVYNNMKSFIGFKKFLRPIINRGLETVTITRVGV